MQAIREADFDTAKDIADKSSHTQRLIDHPGRNTLEFPLNIVIYLLKEIDSNHLNKDNLLKIISWLFTKNACFNFYPRNVNCNISYILYQQYSIWNAVLTCSKKLMVV